jgi:hypothetical protein
LKNNTSEEQIPKKQQFRNSDPYREVENNQQLQPTNPKKQPKSKINPKKQMVQKKFYRKSHNNNQTPNCKFTHDQSQNSLKLMALCYVSQKL